MISLVLPRGCLQHKGKSTLQKNVSKNLSKEKAVRKELKFPDDEKLRYESPIYANVRACEKSRGCDVKKDLRIHFQSFCL